MRKFAKLLCLVLCLCLVITNSPLLLVHAQNNVIEISSLEGFLEFAEDCRLDSFSMGKTFRLTVDIDLTGTDFDGIPIFCGTFEGGNHKLSGLKITSSGSVKGLFRYLDASAIVRELHVEGTIAPGDSRSQVGGIAGNNAGIIENCSFTGLVLGADYVGGIVGYNCPSGIIRNCEASGDVSGKHFAGGIVGNNDGTIQNCISRGSVNTTAQQNNIDFSDINLDNLINAETAATTTDIGGIAGASAGMILGCINLGDVGYPHMGYNVGGIAGLQSGYVALCENYGTVSGRKEVGGIVGQQEPEVLLHYNTDTLQILQSQISVLSDLIARASANANSNTAHIRNLLYKLERHLQKAQDAADYLQESAKQPSMEELQSYADALTAIRDNIAGIGNTLRSLRDAMDETTTELETDMQAISNQVEQIQLTLNQADANLGGQIFDISDQDTDEQLSSKVENCRNDGSIFGDLNVGGILGAVSFENDLDPEEDITILGDVSLNAIGSLRSAVRGCTNAGAVAAKYMRVGGIVGWLTMGLVKDCVNTGSIGTDTVEFAGGIAGDAYGFIRNCKVKAQIYGERNIGGIAGSGAVASDCFAMISLVGAERLGGIFGQANEPASEIQQPILNNYYYTHGADFGGIDGISYEGKAKRLSLQIFLLAQDEAAIFHKVTVTFLADNVVVQKIALPTGSKLQGVPDVPSKDGYIGTWTGLTEVDSNELIFDLTVHAEYKPFITVVQSQNTDKNNRPILLLQGAFSSSADLILKDIDYTAALNDGQQLLQCWEFEADHAVALQAGRLLLPEAVKTDKLILLVRDANGDWSERSFEADESYLVFSLNAGDSAIAVVEQGSTNDLSVEVLIAVGCGMLIVFVIVLLLTKRRKRKVAHSSDPTT